MKIAMPHLGGYLNANFGNSKEFIVIDAENEIISGKKILKRENDQGDLAGMLKDEGVEIVIANMISRPLTEMLFYSGIRVVKNVTGEVEQVAKDFLRGELETEHACRDAGHHGH